ncbi:MAG: bifunctional transaldolase/phosoglucose isomerase [Proteobacteria bacterium]|nr:bifunctional transaldolase/phosoglucose isomerase [Pseudomonadota bacterium]
MNRLKQLEQFGQSVWLDFLSRELIKQDGIRKRIAEDGIGGMTSNPSIFQKSLSQGDAYDADIKHYVEQGLGVGAIFRKLSVKDIQDAADAFRPVYDRTKGADGFISIEVSPYISADTQASIDEAKSLWKEIDRPNLMVKVPGTKDGVPAIRDLIASGININITLLFALDAYQAVADAYIEGLEKRPGNEDLGKISSVASFFLSRIDTMADSLINKKLQDEPGKATELAGIRGKVAIASARIAYQMYKKTFSGPRWEKLAARGARPQRLLWASTGTKNKDYSDTLYVDTLIGDPTVNTMPPETMDAFRDHGTPKADTIEEDVNGAYKVLETLKKGGISLDGITGELVIDGVAKFEEAADKLYGALANKRAKILAGALPLVKEGFGEAQKDIDKEIAASNARGDTRKLWAKDKSAWTGADEDKWLGWTDVVSRELKDVPNLKAFAAEVEKNKTTDIVLLGMGGSSLGAEVLRETFGHREGWPNLHVLDSTDPAQIGAVEKAIKMGSTLFIVSSKSGTTLEPNILFDYFFAASGKAGKQFIAITDPGSSMEKTAKEHGFGHVFYGEPSIGGRYSVLSKFGLVPAAAMGLDVERLLTETQKFVQSTGELVPASANPGARLGIALGVLANKYGRDKVTILASNALSHVGTWLEQLIAESTGKQGKGLIPVDREPVGAPSSYGNDRVFVNLRVAGDEDHTDAVGALEKAGHPTVRITIDDSYQIGQLFYLCEAAIAFAGMVLKIDPFDQPDVEAAKVSARKLTDAYEKNGRLDEGTPFWDGDGIAAYGDGKGRSLGEILKNHLAQLKAGDYFALLAFIELSEGHDAVLQKIRRKVRAKFTNATCFEFGPRFLHSTGQAYKGGPNSGVFLTLTADHKEDRDIPGRKATFGVVEKAQAIGDFSVLVERKRRALRLHMKDADAGLAALTRAFEEALS